MIPATGHQNTNIINDGRISFIHIGTSIRCTDCAGGWDTAVYPDEDSAMAEYNKHVFVEHNHDWVPKVEKFADLNGKIPGDEGYDWEWCYDNFVAG